MNYTRANTSQRPRAILRAVCVYGGLAAGAFLMALPLLWMVSTAFKTEAQTYAYPPQWIPEPITFEHIEAIWTRFPFARYLINSAFIAGAITLLELLTSSMAAYAFARLRFPGRDRIFLLYLATLMVPGQVTVIPNFIVMRFFDWVNTYQGLIIPQAFSALATFMLRQYFLSIPRELEDAARIDGASYWQRFTRIVLPLAAPALAAVGLLSFIAAWNAFFWPLVMTTRNTEIRPITVALRAFQGMYGTEWPLLMAGSTLALVPILIVFFVAQRHIVRGITLSGFGGR